MNFLRCVNEIMTELNLNYEYYEYKSEVTYPYIVGEYIETENPNEDGIKEYEFILTLTSNTTMTQLETIRTTISNYFKPVGKFYEYGGSIVYVNYKNCLDIAEENEDFYRKQINFTIKEWS